MMSNLMILKVSSSVFSSISWSCRTLKNKYFTHINANEPLIVYEQTVICRPFDTAISNAR